MEEFAPHNASPRTGKDPAMYENIQEFIRSFEESMQKQKAKTNQKKKAKGLEKFAKGDSSS